MKDFLKLLDLFDRFFLNEKLDNLKKNYIVWFRIIDLICNL